MSTQASDCTPLSSKEAHRLKARERARLESVKEQRRLRDQQKRAETIQLKEDYFKLLCMYRQLYQQYINTLEKYK